MSAIVSPGKKIWTEAELEALPDDGFLPEVDGTEGSTRLGPNADLNGEHLLPGFHYQFADLFKEWDWE